MKQQIGNAIIANSICSLFEQHGILITKQRLIVINMFCSKVFIKDIDVEWANLRQETNISWASMWATIRLMQKLDVLKTIGTGHCKKQFRLNTAILKRND